jgi:hypothetical protein
MFPDVIDDRTFQTFDGIRFSTARKQWVALFGSPGLMPNGRPHIEYTYQELDHALRVIEVLPFIKPVEFKKALKAFEQLQRSSKTWWQPPSVNEPQL